jgi:hypothetical protein
MRYHKHHAYYITFITFLCPFNPALCNLRTALMGQNLIRKKKQNWNIFLSTFIFVHLQRIFFPPTERDHILQQYKTNGKMIV